MPACLHSWIKWVFFVHQWEICNYQRLSWVAETLMAAAPERPVTPKHWEKEKRNVWERRRGRRREACMRVHLRCQLIVFIPLNLSWVLNRCSSELGGCNLSGGNKRTSSVSLKSALLRLQPAELMDVRLPFAGVHSGWVTTLYLQEWRFSRV